MYGYRTCKMSQIWSPFVHCQMGTESQANSIVYNDGADFPIRLKALPRLHGTGANVLTVGGSTRFMSFANITAEENHRRRAKSPKEKGCCGGIH